VFCKLFRKNHYFRDDTSLKFSPCADNFIGVRNHRITCYTFVHPICYVNFYLSWLKFHVPRGYFGRGQSNPGGQSNPEIVIAGQVSVLKVICTVTIDF